MFQAIVACRQLGYFGLETTMRDYTPTNYSYGLVQCTGVESRIEECFLFDGADCEQPNFALGAVCATKLSPPPITTTTTTRKPTPVCKRI
jgi:hypothetical protein